METLLRFFIFKLPFHRKFKDLKSERENFISKKLFIYLKNFSEFQQFKKTYKN